MENLKWRKVAEGIWMGSVGIAEMMTPLSIRSTQPNREALAELGDAKFPFELEAIRADIRAEEVLLTFPLDENERLYGFGLQFQRMNHRGRTRYLRVNSDPEVDTGETHAPLASWVSSAGYGVLIDTARAITVYAGSTIRKDSDRPPRIRNRGTDHDWAATPVSDTLEAVIPNEQGASVYLFAGSSLPDNNGMLSAVRRYNLFCGGGPLPPRWGLGFWYRISMVASDEEVLEAAKSFREQQIPCDVIGLEPGWHSHCYPTSSEWHEQRFPHPAEFVRRAGEQGFQINIWEHPYISPEAPLYAELLPYSGSHTVWGGLAPDYTIPEAASVLSGHHAQRHIDIGVAGYKIDEVDGSELTGSSWMFPAHAFFPSGLSGEKMRQIYGLLLQRLTEGLYRERNRRTYGLVRATNAGGTSLPYVLYSDLYDCRQFVRALCNSGFGGVLWTPEVREAQTPEEFIRRLQIVCLSPLAMMNAWASDATPWSYPEYVDIVRETIELRMRLQPYLYSAFARYHFEGIPPVRSMQLEMGKPCERRLGEHEQGMFDSTEAPYGLYGQDRSIDDQYMLGDCLLVAPLFPGESRRSVYLPEGVWYEFDTGKRYEGSRFIDYAAAIDQIPLFVRDGGIIPLAPARQHAPQAGERVPLEVRCYGVEGGNFLLYDDDGETFDYERGMYRIIELFHDGRMNTCGERGLEAEGQGVYGEAVWRWMNLEQSGSEAEPIE